MTSSINTSIIMWIGIAALIAWRMYARIRRMVGRQHLSTMRPWITVLVFPLLLGMLILNPLTHRAGVITLLCAPVIGVGLGLYGLHLTRFETTPDGLFYTPNAHLGIALSVILICRIGYRFAHGMIFNGPQAASVNNFDSSPLTLGIFAILAGYYVTYAIGLLRWRNRVTQANGLVTSAPGEAGE